MSIATLWDLIEGEVAKLETTAPVAWPNRQFSPPAKTGNAVTPARWFDLIMEFDDPSTEELTAERDVMVTGHVVIACLIEPNVGDQPATELVDVARALFPTSPTVSGGVTFDVFRPNYFVGGEIKDKSGAELWYGWLVDFEFKAQMT